MHINRRRLVEVVMEMIKNLSMPITTPHYIHGMWFTAELKKDGIKAHSVPHWDVFTTQPCLNNHLIYD